MFRQQYCSNCSLRTQGQEFKVVNKSVIQEPVGLKLFVEPRTVRA